jgi:hypothetical protein
MARRFVRRSIPRRYIRRRFLHWSGMTPLPILRSQPAGAWSRAFPVAAAMRRARVRIAPHR